MTSQSADIEAVNTTLDVTRNNPFVHIATDSDKTSENATFTDLSKTEKKIEKGKETEMNHSTSGYTSEECYVSQDEEKTISSTRSPYQVSIKQDENKSPSNTNFPTGGATEERIESREEAPPVKPYRRASPPNWNSGRNILNRNAVANPGASRYDVPRK